MSSSFSRSLQVTWVLHNLRDLFPENHHYPPKHKKHIAKTSIFNYIYIMNAHDKLFRKVERIKENAIDLIESTFPKDVLHILDIQTMQLDNTSYISKNLKKYYSDLVYTCSTTDKKPVKISILFEHKSYKPDNEYMQLLRYMLNIWEYQLKNKQPITPVIPVIFYHDTVEWIQKDFANYFNITKDSSLRQFIPSFNYILTDLHKYDDEVIKKKLIDVMNTVSENGGNTIMTTYMKIRKERQLEGKREDALKMLKKGFSIEDNTDITESVKLTV